MNINIKALEKKGVFGVTTERGKKSIRIKVTGGQLEAKHLSVLQKIAEEYGNGIVHITSRQGLEIAGIDIKNIPVVYKIIQPVIEDSGINQKNVSGGYLTLGTANISACIGNKVCLFANDDTSSFAKKIEKVIFPNKYNFKIALTGCPNDCIKARMQDFGIIAITEPQYDSYRCIGCKSCVNNCKKRSAGALRVENFKVVRDHDKCIGCGECVGKCPTEARTRSIEKYYKLVIMGRTGKKKPRIAQDFIKWVDEESIIKIILNTCDYIEEYASDGTEHIRYVVDRTGFQEFKKWALKDVNLGPKAEVSKSINW